MLSLSRVGEQPLLTHTMTGPEVLEALVKGAAAATPGLVKVEHDIEKLGYKDKMSYAVAAVVAVVAIAAILGNIVVGVVVVFPMAYAWNLHQKQNGYLSRELNEFGVVKGLIFSANFYVYNQRKAREQALVDLGIYRGNMKEMYDHSARRNQATIDMVQRIINMQFVKRSERDNLATAFYELKETCNKYITPGASSEDGYLMLSADTVKNQRDSREPIRALLIASHIEAGKILPTKRN
ncbi:MAG: hypothetical protein H0X51_08735 [Parachlamydiaceae bacterium]|nr:hypothetical protein [Parachlamydiaceae bacterium]